MTEGGRKEGVARVSTYRTEGPKTKGIALARVCVSPRALQRRLGLWLHAAAWPSNETGTRGGTKGGTE